MCASVVNLPVFLPGRLSLGLYRHHRFPSIAVIALLWPLLCAVTAIQELIPRSQSRVFHPFVVHTMARY